MYSGIGKAIAMRDVSGNLKPWLKQPGQVVDSRGVPIYPGNLLRTYHFRDRNGMNNSLYHTAVCRDGVMWAIPVQELEPTKAGQGGCCLLSDSIASEMRIISDYTMVRSEVMDYKDRPRVKREITSGP